jgi:hypothetical protein
MPFMDGNLLIWPGVDFPAAVIRKMASCTREHFKKAEKADADL